MSIKTEGNHATRRDGKLIINRGVNYRFKLKLHTQKGIMNRKKKITWNSLNKDLHEAFDSKRLLDYCNLLANSNRSGVETKESNEIVGGNSSNVSRSNVKLFLSQFYPPETIPSRSIFPREYLRVGGGR